MRHLLDFVLQTSGSCVVCPFGLEPLRRYSIVGGFGLFELCQSAAEFLLQTIALRTEPGQFRRVQIRLLGKARRRRLRSARSPGTKVLRKLGFPCTLSRVTQLFTQTLDQQFVLPDSILCYLAAQLQSDYLRLDFRMTTLHSLFCITSFLLFRNSHAPLAAALFSFLLIPMGQLRLCLHRPLKLHDPDLEILTLLLIESLTCRMLLSKLRLLGAAFHERHFLLVNF
mmetsp:Transcript_25456/g.61575  ORF Transcript_25456/g.61575 Transcript_25456/m.61575 type:complete len:226 (-) Transcript_25456:1116-1793(-)